MTIGANVERLESLISVRWENLAKARKKTLDVRQMLSESIASERLNSEDVSIVFYGSVGHGEVTIGSDADWTLLIDGQTDSECRISFLTISHGTGEPWPSTSHTSVV